MPNLIYAAAIRNAFTGMIDFDSDTFYAMLTTSGYAPDQDTHAYRSSVTNEITGTNYTAGGKAIPVGVSAIDATNNRVNVEFGPVEWPTLTASGVRQMVIYKRRGGASSADELVAVIDFGADGNVVASTYTVETSTIRVQL